MRRLVTVCLLSAALCVSVEAAVQLSAGSPKLVGKHLVDIGGGHRLNLICVGHGSPTVVFEYGWGSNLLHWQRVQQPISTLTRACFYDRAGYGFSDPATRPMTALNITDDLHALLHRAGISGPIVLVGQSIGGLYATLYFDRFGSEVGGLVLIDPAFAGDAQIHQTARERESGEASFAKSQAELRNCAELARKHELSLADPHGCFEVSPHRTPTEVRYLMYQFLKPYRYESSYSEAVSNDTSVGGEGRDQQEEAHAAKTLGDKPVIVLTAGSGLDDPSQSAREREAFVANWQKGHNALARRSSRGKSLIVPNAGHFIQLDQPQAVVDAIRTVVLEVRNARRESR